MSAMYAFFAEHTNIDPKSLGGYTVEQIEYLMDGFSKNNKTDKPDTLEDEDAIQFLLGGGKL